MKEQLWVAANGSYLRKYAKVSRSSVHTLHLFPNQPEQNQHKTHVSVSPLRKVQLQVELRLPGAAE
jgi:hypothetical protein